MKLALTRKRIEFIVLLALLLVTGIGYGLHWSFTIDDAAISFSYARNFAAGYGLGALYPGAPRVEGYSNLLWVILLAAGTKLGIQTLLVSKLLGLLFSLGVMAVLFLSLRNFIRQPWLLAGLVLLPISLTFTFWSASGLENSLYVSLILLSVYFLVREEQQNQIPFASALVLILVGMTRPEGLIYALAGLGYKVLQLLLNWECQETRRTRVLHLLEWSGIFVLGYGLFKAWHYGYFAAGWPNPIYAKAGWYRIDLQRFWFEPAGWVYLRGFFRTFGAVWMIPALVFGGLVSLKGLQRIFPIFAMATLALPLYTPDWMVNYRFVYPFLPFSAALLVLAADQLWVWIFANPFQKSATSNSTAYKPSNLRPANMQTIPLWLHVGSVILAGFFAFGAARYAWANLRLTERQLACGFEPMAETRCLNGKMYWSMAEVDQKYAELADIASQMGLNDPLYMIPDIGATSYLQNKRILDLAGLGDYQLARIREGNLLKQYIFQEQRPDLVMTYGIWTRRTDLTTFQAFQESYLPIEQGTDENGLIHGTFVRKDLLVSTALNSPDAALCELAPGLFLVNPPVSYTSSNQTTDLDSYLLASLPQQQDWNLEITLLDRNGVQIDQKTAPLGYGWYPTSLWRSNELFRQHIRGLTTPGDNRHYIVKLAVTDAEGNPGAPTECGVEPSFHNNAAMQQDLARQQETLLKNAKTAWGQGDLEGLILSISQAAGLNPAFDDGLYSAPGRSAWRSFAQTLHQAAKESSKQNDWQRAYKLYLAASLANPADAWAQHGLEQARRKWLLGPQSGSDIPVVLNRPVVLNHLVGLNHRGRLNRPDILVTED